MLVLTLVSVVVAQAYAFTTGQSASLVIGQPDFTSSSIHNTETGLAYPYAASFDSAGNLWVVDLGYNRVLMFKPPFKDGMAASLVIGQEDFTHSYVATTQTGLNYPWGLAFDASGNLWVADHNNNRTLMFKPPFATGMAASLVIGQPDFISGSGHTTQAGLNGTAALGFDALGDLWVADNGNNRVVMFKPPFATGMAASLVVGQVDFTHGSFGTSQSQFYRPMGLAFDASGDLWVVDEVNSRVLMFKPPFSNGMAAGLVIGQSNFVSGSYATTQTGLFFPLGVAFDPSGNLWIADDANQRVLRYTSPFLTGMGASLVIGQTDFTHRYSGTTQTALWQPYGLTFDGLGNLWVVDNQNSRVLMFAGSTGLSGFLLELQPGWNLVSLPLVPTQTAIAKLLAPLIQWHDLGIVWAFTPPTTWSFFKPGPPSSGALTKMVDGKGYWVYVTDAFNMTVTGYVVPPGSAPASYPMITGWNLIGFKPSPTIKNETLATYLTSISGKYPVAWVYDNLNQTWLRGAGGLQLAPGEGMWIYLNATATLVPQ